MSSFNSTRFNVNFHFSFKKKYPRSFLVPNPKSNINCNGPLKIVFNIFLSLFFSLIECYWTSLKMIGAFPSSVENFLGSLKFFAFATDTDEDWRKTEPWWSGKIKTSSTCWKMHEWSVRLVSEKKLQFFSNFHFAFFRSTLNKSYTSSSLPLLSFFSSCFIVFPTLVFTKCIDREKKPQYALWSKTINLFKHSLSV